MISQSLVRRDLAVRYAVICFITHSIFISFGLIPGWRKAPLLAGDSVNYVKLAQNIVSNRVFSRESAPPFLWDPYRTPGYPLALAASIRLLGSYQWALYLAAITSGLAGFCAVRFARELGGSVRAQHAAGIITALVPNSLGLSSVLLSDAFSGHLVLVWLYLLYLVCTRASMLPLFISAGVLWYLQSLKPIFNIAFLLILLAGVLYARSKRSWILVVALLVLTLPVPAYFAWRNLGDHGVFTPSMTGVFVARKDLQARHAATEGSDYVSMGAQIKEADREAAGRLQTPASFYGRLYLVQRREVKEFFSAHPATALKLMVTEMVQQFAAPQEFAFLVFWQNQASQTLRTEQPLPVWARAIGSVLTLLFWTCAALGCWQLGRAGDWRPAFLILGVLLFFLVTASLSHWAGARYRFPADMVAIPFAALGLVHLTRRNKSSGGDSCIDREP